MDFKKTAENGLVVGVTAAVAGIAIDAVVSRLFPSIPGASLLRNLASVGAGAAGSYALDKAGYDRLAVGALAGPVMLASASVFLRSIPRHRVDPPAVATAAQLGQPWAPQPV